MPGLKWLKFGPNPVLKCRCQYQLQMCTNSGLSYSYRAGLSAMIAMQRYERPKKTKILIYVFSLVPNKTIPLHIVGLSLGSLLRLAAYLLFALWLIRVLLDFDCFLLMDAIDKQAC